MGGYIKRDIERVEVTALNTKVNKYVFDAFKDCCKEQGYPMNVMLEIFMRQYAEGRFLLRSEEILKWRYDKQEEDTLSTTFSKQIYGDFKDACKTNVFLLNM